MILRIDDTDVERNTEASLHSIFEGLKWLGLGWDEQYRQSERLALHRQIAEAIFQKGWPIAISPPPHTGDSDKSQRAGRLALQSRHARDVARRERPPRRRRRAVRAPLPRPARYRRRRSFQGLVYGEQSKATADIEDFALLRSDGMPTYHLAPAPTTPICSISHIIRGQDHLTNTFKHVLIFEAAGCNRPQFAHLPLLVAPDGAKLSKRKHGPVVSVTTYRDAGFLPAGLHQFPLPAGLVAQERSRS